MPAPILPAAFAAAMMLISATPAKAAADIPQRIVSLNLCTDQLLVLTVPPSRIAAVSVLARDPALSAVAGQARALPVTQPDMESVAALSPDLVLAGPHGAAAAVRLMQARGVPVLQIGLARSFADIRRHVGAVAQAAGVPQAGARLVAEMDATLDALPPAPRQRPRALVYGANGFAAGAGTLTDAVLRAAGFTNSAQGLPPGGFGFIALETLAVTPPDALIVEQTDPARPSLAHALLRHRALRALPSARLALDGAAVACGGPFTAAAARALAAQRLVQLP